MIVVFQEDLYPPTFSGLPSHTAAEWMAGSEKPPKLCSLDPADAGKEVKARMEWNGGRAKLERKAQENRNDTRVKNFFFPRPLFLIS